jgi:hypothetical protein
LGAGRRCEPWRARPQGGRAHPLFTLRKPWPYFNNADTYPRYRFAWELIFFFCTFVIGMTTRRTLAVQALLVVGLLSAGLHAQNVGIGTATPDPSARLHIEDNARGLLIPRVALTATNSAAPVTTTPATGLLVYNTNTAGTGATAVTPGFYYWDGNLNQWVRLADGGKAWLLTGNAGTNPATNFLGTTDAQPLCIRVDNQETFRFNPPGASAPAWSIQRGGGDPRGLHAVDLQSARSAATQVASGDYSVISGGRDNTASGVYYATVGGGRGNTASGWGATVGGGGFNTASRTHATVGGGERNTASGDAATVGGGDGNTASGELCHCLRGPATPPAAIVPPLAGAVATPPAARGPPFAGAVSTPPAAPTPLC